MDRRTLLAGISVFLPGCLGRDLARNGPSRSNKGNPEQDDGPVHQLGAAQPTTMTAEPDREYEHSDESSFDEWVTTQAAWAAVPRIQSVLEEEELMEPAIHVSVNTAALDDLDVDVDESEFDRAAPLGVFVRRTSGFLVNGEQVAEPKFAFDRLVAASPRSISVTLVVDDSEQSVVLPVICRNEQP